MSFLNDEIDEIKEKKPAVNTKKGDVKKVKEKNIFKMMKKLN